MLAVCSLAISQPAKAQSLPPMQTLIEDLSPAASECGVDRELLDSAAKSTGRYYYLMIIPEAPVYLYVNVLVRRMGEQCVYALDTSIFGHGLATVGGQERRTKNVICDQGGMGAAPRVNTPTAVTSFVKSAIERCLASI